VAGQHLGSRMPVSGWLLNPANLQIPRGPVIAEIERGRKAVCSSPLSQGPRVARAFVMRAGVGGKVEQAGNSTTASTQGLR
jgi:hypothetical protein